MKAFPMWPIALAIAFYSLAEAPPADLKFQDLYFRDVTLSAKETTPACVLFFFSNTCPVARRYMPRIIQLEAGYRARGVQFIAVNASPADSHREVAQFAMEFKIPFPVLKDSDFSAVKALGVTRTPEVVVLDQRFETVYQGRIDDQYRLGGVRPTATRHDLAEALDAVLEGRPVPASRIPAEGCVLTVPGGVGPDAEPGAGPFEQTGEGAPLSPSYDLGFSASGDVESGASGGHAWVLAPVIKTECWVNALLIQGEAYSASVYYDDPGGTGTRHYLAGALLPGQPLRWDEDEGILLPAGAVLHLAARGSGAGPPVLLLDSLGTAPASAITCIASSFSVGRDRSLPAIIDQVLPAGSRLRCIAPAFEGYRGSVTVDFIPDGGPPISLLSLPALDPRWSQPFPLGGRPEALKSAGNVHAALHFPGYLTWPPGENAESNLGGEDGEPVFSMFTHVAIRR